MADTGLFCYRPRNGVANPLFKSEVAQPRVNRRVDQGVQAA